MAWLYRDASRHVFLIYRHCRLADGPLVAMLAPRFDPRLLVSGGIVWLAALALTRTFWTTDSDFWTLTIPQFVQGLGMTFS